MKRKLLYITLLTLALVCSLAACSTVQNPPSQGGQTHTHAFGEWTTSRESTCTMGGLEERSCSCGEKETRMTDAHTPVTDAAVEATCAKPGLTEGSHCSVCKTVIVKQEAVEQKPHTADDWIVDTAATCSKTGFMHKECTVCHASFDEKEIDALPHTPITDPFVDSTCTATGLTEGSHCSVCGITITKQQVISEKAHTLVIDAAVEATCSASGLTQGCHCSACNITIIKQRVIPKKAHTLVIDAGVAATCTATGLTEGSHCSVCNATIVAREVVDALGHTPSEKITDIPESCTSDGSYHIDCTVCFEMIERGILKRRHSYASTVVHPTALEQGYTEHVCTRCKDTYTDAFVPALGFADFTYTVNKDGKSCTLTKLSDNTKSEIAVPLEIDGYTVTVIGENTFADCTQLTRILLPDTIQTIEASAFRSCSALVEITIPNSVMSIGAGAFSGCSALESITLPFVGERRKTESDTYQYPLGYIFGTSSYSGGVETYQSYYGSDTYSTTTVAYYIPATLKSVTVTDANILSRAFYNCNTLTSVTLGENVTSIGGKAFSGCRLLTSVTIGENVTTIQGWAFNGCPSLKSITIPDGVTSIGAGAFYNVPLESLTIGKNVKSIGMRQFPSVSK